LTLKYSDHNVRRRRLCLRRRRKRVSIYVLKVSMVEFGILEI